MGFSWFQLQGKVVPSHKETHIRNSQQIEFFGHSEVAILILPGFGLISQIINQEIGKIEIFNNTNTIYAIIAIGDTLTHKFSENILHTPEGLRGARLTPNLSWPLGPGSTDR